MENIVKERINKALEFALRYGGIDGDHHKAWVIDQMVRALTGCPMIKTDALDCNNKPYSYEEQGVSGEYGDWVRNAKDGEDGANTYDWDEGIAP